MSDADKEQSRKDSLRTQIREFLRQPIPKKVFGYDHPSSAQYKATVIAAEKTINNQKATVKSLSDLLQRMRLHYET